MNLIKYLKFILFLNCLFGFTLGVQFGSDAQANEFPHHVLIFHHGKYVCSGSLINSSFVLTIGSCFRTSTTNYDYEKKPPFLIVGGLTKFNFDDTAADYTDGSIDGEESQNITSSSPIIYHPCFMIPEKNDPEDRPEPLYDIALIKLDSNFNFKKIINQSTAEEYGPINSIKLAESNSNHGGAGIVIGFGKGEFRDDDQHFPILQKANASEISSGKCEKSLKTNMTKYRLCIGPKSYNCFEDRGSSFVSQNEGEMKLIGVFSWNKNCFTNPNDPNIFTKIAMFIDWINFSNWPEPCEIPAQNESKKGRNEIDDNSQSTNVSTTSYPPYNREIGFFTLIFICFFSGLIV